MDVGLIMPTRGPLATPDAIRALARRAEELGYAHFSTSDHLVVPRSIDSRYPYSASGSWPGAASGDCFDLLTLLAYVAGLTTKPRLITAVAVVPYRGAVHTAKIAATIDVLSGGRMVLGVGAGWLREEFEALGAPPFEERGRVTDEWLQAFKILWTEDAPRFEGRHVGFANISFAPKPVQKPHPPIWVGGESPAALRRAVRYGDVWFPIGNNPRHPLDTVARLKAGVEPPPATRGAERPRPGEPRGRLLRGVVQRDTDPAGRGRRAPHHDRDPGAGRRGHRRPRRAGRQRPRAQPPARHARELARQHGALHERDEAAPRVARPRAKPRTSPASRRLSASLVISVRVDQAGQPDGRLPRRHPQRPGRSPSSRPR